METMRLLPPLDWPTWRSSAETLHMFVQIVGKTRLALTPKQNHWWNVPLYVTARGLSTSVMPLSDGDRLEVEFDFTAHQLTLRRGSGQNASLPLQPQTVAKFYEAYRRALSVMAVEVHIDRMPVECKDPVRFDLDTQHRSYDAEAVHRFFQVLSYADARLKQFSTAFYGKISPVHFFWGSFDLAVTRFNGRRAAPHPGADAIQAEAYSHECISAGFWPGNGGYGRAAYYCYAAPVPEGLADVSFPGPGAFDKVLGEFVLDYDDVRESADPAGTVLDFLQSSYAACAGAARWDRGQLDRVDTAPVRG